MNKYKLTIAYEGTHYSGWQVQPNALSVQQVLQQVLSTILQHDVSLVGAGRTDAGVHALAQVAHFQTDRDIALDRFLASVNSLLPCDIRVLQIEQVADSFHAQYSALGKIYYYHFSTAATRDPFSRHHRFHVPYAVDLTRLQEAAQCFVGTHDFCAFANVSFEGVASYDSVRTIKRIDLVEEHGGWRLEFEGDGFLYKMVRNITGTLFEIASGKRDCSEVQAILNSRDRKKAGKTAPAHGLFLVKVFFLEP